MLMIVAHHFVVNSGVAAVGGPIRENPQSAQSIYLLIFGAWGKTGINCFLMITGYFMCKSQITIRKFLKLVLQLLFYSVIIYSVFLIAGLETINAKRLFLLLPVWNVENNFPSCFVVFYLTIPFWNILVSSMSKRLHEILLLLLLTVYTLLGSIPNFNISFNYVTWFGIIYLIASYVRLYPRKIFEKKGLWRWLTIISFILACMSILITVRFSPSSKYFFVSDSNKIFAVAVAVCSFLWFKNMKHP